MTTTCLNPDPISTFQKTCMEEHKKLGKPLSRLLSIAALVVSIYIAVMIKGIGGVVVGLAVFLGLSRLVCKKLCLLWANHDYLEAAKAFDSEDFLEWIEDKNLDISTIVELYKKYKDETYSKEIDSSSR